MDELSEHLTHVTLLLWLRLRLHDDPLTYTQGQKARGKVSCLGFFLAVTHHEAHLLSFRLWHVDKATATLISSIAKPEEYIALIKVTSFALWDSCWKLGIRIGNSATCTGSVFIPWHVQGSWECLVKLVIFQGCTLEQCNVSGTSTSTSFVTHQLIKARRSILSWRYSDSQQHRFPKNKLV